MILTCPNCQVRYILPAASLAPDGRRVKCTKCDETWFQDPDLEELEEENVGHGAPEEEYDSQGSEDDIPHVIRPAAEGAGVPALSEGQEEGVFSKRNLAAYGVGAGVFALIFAFLLSTPKTLTDLWLPIAGFYQALGYETDLPAEGLVFDRVEVTLDKQKEGSSLVISGQIINLTGQKRVVPLIEAVAFDNSGAQLSQWYIKPRQETMSAQETMDFSTSFQEMKEGANELRLRFVLEARNAAEDGGSN